MKRTFSFGVRCAKEIVRDPLTIGFSLGFPLVLLALLTAIQANIPDEGASAELFKIEHLSPGIAVFGLAFMTLFSATLISRDRETALLERLYTTPMRPINFILGYMLPIIPISLAQSAVCFAFALILGLKASPNILLAILFMIPISVLFISTGLLAGSVLGVKQVGGICGALFTNLTAFLSGVWFPVDLVGGFFKKFAYALPFIHAVELERAVLSGDFVKIPEHLAIVLVYGVLISAVAIFLFLRQMRRR